MNNRNPSEANTMNEHEMKAELMELNKLFKELAPDRAYYEHEDDKGAFRCCDAMQFNKHDCNCKYIKIKEILDKWK